MLWFGEALCHFFHGEISVICTQTKSFLTASAFIHIRNILTYGKRYKSIRCSCFTKWSCQDGFTMKPGEEVPLGHMHLQSSFLNFLWWYNHTTLGIQIQTTNWFKSAIKISSTTSVLHLSSYDILSMGNQTLRYTKISPATIPCTFRNIHPNWYFCVSFS